ncbi:hypothetical protein NBRC116583_02820 [Arenicella sp. 4NH20-0111]|uniref:hypothetical protein n=1 Tax=Arenicella sp. 4NH20-0111 TaxID=3127648 RepID=UPI003102C4D2
MNKVQKLSLLALLLFQGACSHAPKYSERISGHRVIFIPETPEENQRLQGDSSLENSDLTPQAPHIDIALTNTSHLSLCDVKAKIVGVNNPDAVSNVLPSDIHRHSIVKSVTAPNWHPGRVWYLGLDEKFQCVIPVHVIITYSYLKPKKEFKPKDYFQQPIVNDSCDSNGKGESRKRRRTKVYEFVKLPHRPTAISTDNLKVCGFPKSDRVKT